MSDLYVSEKHGKLAFCSTTHKTISEMKKMAFGKKNRLKSKIWQKLKRKEIRNRILQKVTNFEFLSNRWDCVKR